MRRDERREALRGQRRVAGLGAAAVAVVAAVGISSGAAGQAGDAAETAAGPEGITTEIVLNARRAKWRPEETSRRGRLILDGVAPRMAVMAAAPRREIAVVPASLLGANWRRLFGASGGETNIVVAAKVRGTERLMPMRARLVRRHRTGRRFVLQVAPLRRTAHRTDSIGGRRTLRDVTVVVDPIITPEMVAFWKSLIARFFGVELTRPRNPTFPDGAGTTYDRGGADFDPGSFDPGDYKGAIGTFVDDGGREALQRSVLDQTGPWQGDARSTLSFTGASYDGLAIFNHDDYDTITFAAGAGRVTLTKLALFETGAQTLVMRNADVGGANMRSLRADELDVANSLLEAVDMTGASLGGGRLGEEQRSRVVNSAWVGIRAGVDVRNPDGTPDESTGAAFSITDTDFVSVTFQDVSLPSAVVMASSFQGCGFQNVDFSQAVFHGDPVEEGETWRATFENSIMENVNFEDAGIRDVSFRGVDFGNGGVSFDGARLANVDFTGATGLQTIDWSKVIIEGPVYGLAEYGHLLQLEDPSYLRSISFDGQRPEVDPDTGFDIEPRDGYLVDPATGVRLERGFGGLQPVDPATGQPLRDPQTGRELELTNEGLVNPDTGERFEVDYETGRL